MVFLQLVQNGLNIINRGNKMKIRQGYVSNSSSSSFIVAFKEPEDPFIKALGGFEKVLVSTFQYGDSEIYGKQGIIIDTIENFPESEKNKILSKLGEFEYMEWEVLYVEIENHEDSTFRLLDLMKEMKLLETICLYNN